MDAFREVAALYFIDSDLDYCAARRRIINAIGFSAYVILTQAAAEDRQSAANLARSN